MDGPKSGDGVVRNRVRKWAIAARHSSMMPVSEVAIFVDLGETCLGPKVRCPAKAGAPHCDDARGRDDARGCGDAMFRAHRRLLARGIAVHGAPSPTASS